MGSSEGEGEGEGGCGQTQGHRPADTKMPPKMTAQKVAENLENLVTSAA
jgi:hypothetical protein